MMLVSKPSRSHGVIHALAGLLVQLRVANDSSFADLAFPHFELGLYQDNHFARPASKMRQRPRQNHGDGDEADIANRQVDGSPMSARRQIARVHAFVHDHARIVAQFPVELAGADVDGVHARGAALQQAIGEAAGRGADVEADFARHVDAEMIERRFQLQAAAADVPRLCP